MKLPSNVPFFGDRTVMQDLEGRKEYADGGRGDKGMVLFVVFRR